MNTDTTQDDGGGPESSGAAVDPAAQDLGWWQRGHPVFTPLSGFFTGLLVVIVVPGLFAALLTRVFDYDTASELFPLVLVILAVPLGLMVSPRSRTFGRYMLLGMVLTAVVVAVVGALVVWLLVRLDS